MKTAEAMEKMRQAWIQAIENNPGILYKDRDDEAYDKMIDDVSIPVLRQFAEDLREKCARKWREHWEQHGYGAITNAVFEQAEKEILSIKIE